MKKALSLLMLAVTFVAYGQRKIVIENPYYKNFKELNTNNIPTGILLDYAYTNIDVKKFNGTLQDSTYTTKENFNVLYQSVLSGILQKKNNLNQLDVFQKWQAHRKENIITLAGLLFNYNAINAVAVQNGKMQVFNGNSKTPIAPSLVAKGTLSSDNIVFKENPSPTTAAAKSTPLYTNHYAFAIAPSVNSLNSSQFSVVLPKDVLATNTNIQSVEINFNDGKGYQNLQYNTSLQVNYTQTQIYTWIYKVHLTNGTILYSHSKFQVKELTNTIKSTKKNTAGFINDKTIVTATKNGHSYHGLLEVNDANGDGIRNPVIIAEGFDTGIVTNPESPEGAIGARAFRTSTFKMNDGENVYNHDLLNELYFKGRDVIYVNWRNGMDYIENNAEVLKEVIRLVNTAKRANGSTVKNVIIGQSMGGLVTRYALKDMEDTGEKHDTRLFVSHDTPYQGANASLSVQYMFRHLRKIVIRNPVLYTASESFVPLFNDGLGGSDYYNLLNNPAVRQMVMNWVDKDYNIDNTFHNAWQNKLKAKGYPQQTRNIAISNGDVCGSFNSVGKTVLSVHKAIKPGYALDIFISSLLGTGGFRLDHNILGLVPGSPRYKFNMYCRPALRNGGGGNIYDGLLSYKKKVLWLVPITIHLSSKKVNQPNDVLPYDELPGGFFSLAQDALPDFLEDAVKATPSSFIPSISALDYGRGNINHSQSAYENVIYQNNPNIPFDAYILEKGSNRQHITFSNLNSVWLVNELKGTPQTGTDEALFCPKDKSIVASENFECGEGTAKFETNFNAPRFEWKVTSGAHLIVNETDANQRSFEFTVKPNVKGKLRISLRYGDVNFSRSTTFTKEYWIGKPEAVGQLTNICINVFVQPSNTPEILLPKSGGADTYNLVSNSPYLRVGGSVSPGLPIPLFSHRVGNYTATLTTSNKCGTSTGTINVTTSNCNNGGGTVFFSVYPNPSSNGMLTIKNNAKEESSPAFSKASFSSRSNNTYSKSKNTLTFTRKEDIAYYEIYSLHTSLVQKGVLNQQINQLNLSSLRKGMYILKIYEGENVETHHIVIE